MRVRFRRRAHLSRRAFPAGRPSTGMSSEAIQRMASDESRDPGHASMELVRRAQNGDKLALNKLFARCYPGMQALLRLHLGSELPDPTGPPDMLHRAFSAAVDAFDRFDLGEEALLNAIGRMAVRESNATAGNPFFSMLHDHLKGFRDVRGLQAALANLPEEHREVILLRSYGHADWETISEWMGLPGPDAARIKYARVIVELSLSMRRDGGGTTGD